MGLDRCLFVVWLARDQARAEVELRAGALARFYAPLESQAQWRWVEPARALVGSIAFDGGDPDLGGLLVFGEHARGTPALRGAPDERLRALEGSGTLIELGEDSVTAVVRACAPGTLYASSSEDARAWSTHAVAAGWLAQGFARLDTSSLPEFLAAEFVGGERTLLEGVNALPLATSVELDRGEPRSRCFWPAAERWAPVPASEAQEHGEQQVLRSLEHRLGGAAAPFCGLTAGLDSRVVAVALKELGISFEAYTWGEPDSPDVTGGAEVAQAIGVPHHFQPFELFGDEAAFDFVDREVRWNEGLVQVGFGRPTWPEGMTEFVTGGGGETGRCFYYRQSVRSGVTPDAEQLAGVMMTTLGGRVAAAHPAALATLRRRVESWIADAEGSGLRGWRLLDVLYADQRVRRWTRGMLPLSRAPMVPALAAPEVSRALISQPLSDRAADAFHRRFIARCAPALEPAAPPPPRRGVVPPLLRRVRARLPGLSRPLSARPSLLAEQWERRPGFRAWVADDVLGSPLLEEALGERWAGRTRERFLAGDAHAEDVALWAGGPVALESALRDLDAALA
jgi:hypothetical protein